MNKYLRTISGSLLSAALVTNLIPVQIYAEEVDNNPTEKTETVYCVLNEDGTPSSTTVSNWIHDEDGIHNVQETIQLSNVETTQGDITPSVDGNTYTWNSKETDVYYQGDTTKKLPVSVHVKYYLDNKEISSKDLEGKKGHLKCVISLDPTITKTVQYGDKSVDIHPAFLCGGALVFNTKSAKNLTVSQGQVMQEGDSSIISFVAVPGLEASLKQMDLEKVIDSYDIQDEITIEGDVDACEIKTMVMGMTNGFNFDTLNSIDALSELTGGINELMNASNQIEDGSIQLYDGTTELIEKTTPLTSAYPQIQQLAVSADMLNDGAKLVKDGVITYVNGSKTLNTGIQTLNEGAGQMAGSTQIAQGMKALSQGLDQYDQALLQTQAMLQNNETFTELNGIIDSSKVQLEGMSQVLVTANSSITQLSSAMTALQQLISVLQSSCVELQNAYATLSADNQTITNDNEIIQQYNEIITGTQATLTTSIGILQNALADEGLSEEDKVQIQGQIAELNNQLANLSLLSELSSLDSCDLTTLTTNLQTIQTILSQLDLTAIQAQLTSMQTMLEQANTALDGMSKNIATAQNDISQLNLTGMVAQLEQYASEFSKNGKVLSTYMDQLDNGISQIRLGIGQINEGSNELNSYDQSLIDGVIALQNGTQQLSDNKDSFNQMADGLQQLSAAFKQLNTGAKELSDGCHKFNVDGMQTLKNKVDLTTEELNRAVDLFNQIIELNNEHTDFIGSPEMADVTTRYILRME